MWRAAAVPQSFSAEVKNKWSYTSTPPNASMACTRTILPSTRYGAPHCEMFSTVLLFFSPIQKFSSATCLQIRYIYVIPSWWEKCLTPNQPRRFIYSILLTADADRKFWAEYNLFLISTWMGCLIFYCRFPLQKHNINFFKTLKSCLCISFPLSQQSAFQRQHTKDYNQLPHYYAFTHSLIRTLHIVIIITFLCIKRCVSITSEISRIIHTGLSLYCTHGNKKDSVCSTGNQTLL